MLQNLIDGSMAVGKLALAAFFLFYGGLIWINQITSFRDLISIMKNPTYAVQRGGVMLGLAIGLLPFVAGTVTKDGEVDRTAEFIWLGAGGLVLVLLVAGLIRRALQSWVAFDRSTEEGRLSRTLSVGIARALLIVAACIIFNGAARMQLGSAGIKAAGTQLGFAVQSLVLWAMVYRVGVAKLKLNEKIRGANESAALMAGGFALAFALVINGALTSYFSGWGSYERYYLKVVVVTLVGFALCVVAINRAMTAWEKSSRRSEARAARRALRGGDIELERYARQAGLAPSESGDLYAEVEAIALEMETPVVGTLLVRSVELDMVPVAGFVTTVVVSIGILASGVAM